jgi:hypothetical protein
MRSDAYISADGKYRYWLLRIWDDTLPIMANIGCNPSKADALLNDPTIRKDIGFATRFGFGGLLKLNIGAYRATDPKKWRKAFDPFGPENTINHLRRYMNNFSTTKTVVTWGRCIGPFAGQANYIVRQLGETWCFGTNSNGTPRHTLMLPYTARLELYVQP